MTKNSKLLITEMIQLSAIVWFICTNKVLFLMIVTQ